MVSTSGLHGRVYHLDPDTNKLPKFDRMKPAGNIYTTTLNIWPQQFDEGFPSITDRFEWFGIRYTGKIWIETPGTYGFSLLSDDGAKLKLNDKTVIDNDGTHRANAISANTTLSRGVYEIEIDYYQGPRFNVALVLAVQAPGQSWRILNMDDFRPPKDQDEWQKGKVQKVHRQTIPPEKY